jgi:hypothetical protein
MSSPFTTFSRRYIALATGLCGGIIGLIVSNDISVTKHYWLLLPAITVPFGFAIFLDYIRGRVLTRKLANQLREVAGIIEKSFYSETQANARIALFVPASDRTLKRIWSFPGDKRKDEYAYLNYMQFPAFARAFKGGEQVLVGNTDDATMEHLFPFFAGKVKHLGFGRSFMAVPIQDGERIVGIVSLDSDKPISEPRMLGVASLIKSMGAFNTAAIEGLASENVGNFASSRPKAAV